MVEEEEQKHDLIVNRSLIQFIFPFQIKKGHDEELLTTMEQEGLEFFQLEKTELQDKYYGEYEVSHRSLERYFLPNIEPILYPKKKNHKQGFRRFSKAAIHQCQLDSELISTPFKVQSYDIILFPFNIGMINIRVQLPEDLPYSDVLHFSDLFRQMDIPEEIQNRIRIRGDKEYKEARELIFQQICPFLSGYIEEQEQSSYFGSLPFFIDERMFVIGYYSFQEDTDIERAQVFRAGQLNGYDMDGKPFVGAHNQEYIDRYWKRHVYDRWADESFYVISDYAFMCLTKLKGKRETVLIDQMYGQLYYGLLLFLFYKLVLLKLSYEHSRVDIEKKRDAIEKLIIGITDFSAKYFFPEVYSRTSGREIFSMVKDVFQIEILYDKVKKTMDSLYQNQEKLTSRRHDYLLTILTTYTVISGIYGMNLVIEDWRGKIRWDKVPSYTFFEWICMIVALSGIAIGIILGFTSLWNWLSEKYRRKDRMNH